MRLDFRAAFEAANAKKGDETQWNSNYARREKTVHTHTHKPSPKMKSYKMHIVISCVIRHSASWITMFIGMLRQWALSMHYKCVHTLRTEFHFKRRDAYCWQVSKEQSYFKMYHGLDHVFDKMKITNYFNEHGVPQRIGSTQHIDSGFSVANL